MQPEQNNNPSPLPQQPQAPPSPDPNVQPQPDVNSPTAPDSQPPLDPNAPQQPEPETIQPTQQPSVQPQQPPAEPVSAPPEMPQADQQFAGNPTPDPYQSQPTQPNLQAGDGLPPSQTDPFSQPDGGYQATPISQEQPEKKSRRKLILIILGAVFGLLILATVALLAVRLSGTDAPIYNETQQVSIEGPEEDAGMTFDVPVEMSEDTKTDASASYTHYRDENDKNRGTYARVEAAIQTVSLDQEIDQERLDQIAESFAAVADQDLRHQLESDPATRNVTLESEEASENNNQLRLVWSLENRTMSPDGSEQYEPAIAVFTIKIEGRHAYTFGYQSTRQVHDANQEFFASLEDSIQIAR